MKIALTTVTNDERYCKNLDLISSAWKDCGYELKVVLVLDMNEKLPTKLPCNVCDIICLPISRQSKKSQFISEVQSLRFYYATAFSSDDYVLITDADIIPISKSHFSLPDEQLNSITHFNAALYSIGDSIRYPACYYGMKSGKWRDVINPRKSNVFVWLSENVDASIIGVDEHIAYKAVRNYQHIRKFIGKDARIDKFNVNKVGDIKNKVKIIDFHFQEMESELVKKVYNEIRGYESE